MGVHHPSSLVHAKQILHKHVVAARVVSEAANIPKGYLAVYVEGGQKKCFVVLISYLNQPSFQVLPHKTEEEFGFDHIMGNPRIPYREDIFLNLTSHFTKLHG